MCFSDQSEPEESVRSTKKRVLQRLKEGEDEDDIYLDCFDQGDTQAMDVLPGCVSYLDKQEEILLKKRRKKEADNFLARGDLYNWEKFIVRVSYI